MPADGDLFNANADSEQAENLRSACVRVPSISRCFAADPPSRAQDQCRATRKKCETEGPQRTCTRCRHLGLECLYSLKGKPGRRRHGERRKRGPRPAKDVNATVEAVEDESDRGEQIAGDEPAPRPPHLATYLSAGDAVGARSPKAPAIQSTRRENTLGSTSDSQAPIGTDLVNIEQQINRLTLGFKSFALSSSSSSSSHSQAMVSRGATIFQSYVIHSVEDEDAAPQVLLPNFAPAVPLPNSMPRYQTPLPDEDILNYLMKTYIEKLYPTNPIVIKSEFLKEMRSNSLPDYIVFSILFWASRWDVSLADVVGPIRRAQITRSFFDALVASLLPALELALAGYDAMVGSDVISYEQAIERNRAGYLETVIWVLVSLFHLLGYAIAYPRDPTDPAGTFANFRLILTLATRVMHSARFFDFRRFGRRAPALLEPTSPVAAVLHDCDYFSVWIERGRRVFWGMYMMDTFASIMYGGDPYITWREAVFVGALMSDDEFLAAKAVADSYIFEADATALANATSGRRPWTPSSKEHERPPPAEFVEVPPIIEGDDILLTAPIKSVYRLNGVRIMASFVVRLAQLGALCAKYRRLVPTPYLDRPGRLHLMNQLNHWMLEMPPPFPNGVVAIVAQHKDLLGTPQGVTIGAMAYFMLMYYGINAMLSSPSGELLWSGQLDLNWASSPAFVTAQEHAISATLLLTPIVESRGTMPQMSLPFFQWCVATTGLLHFAFLRSLLELKQLSPDAEETIRMAREQLRIHAAALRKCQGGVGLGDRKSWWYESWVKATGLE